MADAKKPFHEELAAKLIEQLEQGVAPWQRPWKTGEISNSLPFNPTTGKRYKGVNALNLLSADRADPRWLTYNQARAIDAQVRKGEKATVIQYWQFTEEKTSRDENGRPKVDDEGRELKEHVKLQRPRMFMAAVFNGEQVDGLPPLVVERPSWDPIERAEQILQRSEAVIQHSDRPRAFYSSAVDAIHMPDRALFPEASGYYSTALHELGHWTGHESRLARDLSNPFGSEAYAREELRAEIASMILGRELGIGHNPDNHVAYVQSWIEVLKNDPMEIFRAAADAEKIHEYVIALEHRQVQALDSNQHSTDPIAQELDMAPNSERQYLDVPYSDKQAAKKLGAQWDADRQAWYVPPGADPQPFAKWTAQEATKTAQEAVSDASRSQRSSDGEKNAQNRVYLAVPYGERSPAKAAGAKWDQAAKVWYAPAGADIDKLTRWLPTSSAQQTPAVSPIDEFADALRAMGCLVDGKHPVMDGQKQRIPVEGDRKGETGGFYVGHLDGHPAGYIKNNRTGLEIRWKSKGYSLPPEQKAALQAEAATKLAARAAEQTQVHEATAKRVADQLRDLKSIETPTPYLAAKGVNAHPGALTDAAGKKTYLPAVDVDGKQWTMQYISEEGTKRFAKNSHKEGCFHPLGGMPALAKAPAIVIAEGYATAATVAAALRIPTVAAFDSGNLEHVARALHQKYPDKAIVIAGDDDRHIENNPGRTAAEAAARAVGGRAVFPIFAPGEQSAEPRGFTDFNDLQQKSVLGHEAVERQLQPILEQQLQIEQARQLRQTQTIGVDDADRQQQRTATARR